MIEPTKQTAAKHRRASEPDLVDRIFDLLAAEQPDLMARLTEIKAAIRAQVGGEVAYVRKRDDIGSQVLSRFNGRNATEVARELGIGRTTVYRLLKQPGR